MAHTASILSLDPAARFQPPSSAGVKAEPSRAVRLRFGPFELDPRSGELTSGDTTVVLQQQPLQVMLMLTERYGEMVTRDEIQERLWGNDVIVDFDRSINQLVRRLRRVLGDSAEAPKYIETIARRGYRLKGTVEVIDKANSRLASLSHMSPSKLPAEREGYDAGEPSLSHRRSFRWRAVSGATQPSQRSSRFQARAVRETEERGDRPTTPIRTLATQQLRHQLGSSDPAEKLDALRQLLVLVTELIDG